LIPKYNKIGVGYDNTRTADPYLASRLIEHLELRREGIYLDVGCGTGNYTEVLWKEGISIIGIDPSETMLEKARRRNIDVDWQLGVAESLNFPNNHFDGIVATLTIHHWNDLEKAFKELGRVLKPGGRIVLFTSTPEQMESYWLNHYFPQMLRDSTSQMPGLDKVREAMKAGKLRIINTEKYFVKPDLQDKFLQCGKQNPEMYFDENIRKGISSFSSLGNKEEVERGLSKLRADIDTGKIESFISSFDSDLGDYLFVIANKPV